MAAGNSQDTIIGAHGGDHQDLLAHVLHYRSEEVPADAVEVVQVLQHDGQWAICCHKLFQYLQVQLPCQMPISICFLCSCLCLESHHLFLETWLN